MIQYNNLNQRTIAEFDWPFHTALDAHNRWVTLSQCMPWYALSQGDHKSLSSKRGRPKKQALRRALKHPLHYVRRSIGQPSACWMCGENS